VQNSEWENEALGIPHDIIKAIKEVLLWPSPSKIQYVSIPYILSFDEQTLTYDHLIAQA
jgi:superfamily II DNA/RNA helicase